MRVSPDKTDITPNALRIDLNDAMKSAALCIALFRSITNEYSVDGSVDDSISENLSFHLEVIAAYLIGLHRNEEAEDVPF